MLVTLLAMVTRSKPPQPAKTSAPMPLTPCVMTSVFTFMPLKSALWISPDPRMVRTPASLRVYVRSSPHVPLVSAEAAAIRQTISSSAAIISLFIDVIRYSSSLKCISSGPEQIPVSY